MQTSVEYMEAFYQLVARVFKSEDQMVVRYIIELRPSIQDFLNLPTSWSVLEAYNMALLVGKNTRLV